MGAFIHFIVNLNPEHRVYIQTHDFPDPDAIASAYGLKEILKAYGIHAQLCYKGHIESTDVSYILDAYKIPIHEYDHIEPMQDCDQIILVDGQKFNTNMTDLPGSETGCIDHHTLNRKAGADAKYTFVDIRPVGACASIITEYYHKLGVPLTRESATLLLFGLKVDTNYFQRGVTPLDIEAFKILYPAADHSMLRRLAGRSLKSDDLLAFGLAIKDIHIKDGLGIVKIPFACPDHLIAQVADFILALAEVDIAIIYSPRDRGLKFSARSVLPDVHCGNMLRVVLSRLGGNGGGHMQMAGGFIPEWKSEEQIEKYFEEYLKKLRESAHFPKIII